MVRAFSLPKIMEKEIDVLVKTGYYSSKSDVVKDALRIMMRTRPQLRIAVAVELFKSGGVSLGKGAELASMTIEEFKETLKARGIKRKIRAPSKKEMKRRTKKVFGQ